MAIIMDKEDHKGEIIMVDNGYGNFQKNSGYKVTIPSIFIHH